MPHCGQRPGSVAGHLGVHRAGVRRPARPAAPARSSISATSARILSGGAASHASSRAARRPAPARPRSASNSRRARRRRRLLGDGDRGQRVGPVRGAVLQRQRARPVEQHVDHRPLRRRQQHLLDELLPLDPAAVAADQLHAGAGQPDVEDPRVGGVGQPEPHDLAGAGGQRRRRARRRPAARCRTGPSRRRWSRSG